MGSIYGKKEIIICWKIRSESEQLGILGLRQTNNIETCLEVMCVCVCVWVSECVPVKMVRTGTSFYTSGHRVKNLGLVSRIKTTQSRVRIPPGI
jgi:hypothetical protein